MSRKIFGVPEADQTNAVKTQVEAAKPERRVHARPLMGLGDLSSSNAQPVGAFGASLNQLEQRGKRAEEIEKQLAAGQSVVNLDTALIDPSFVSDRMPLTEEALADLVQAIRDNTQLSPVLVRPHPEKPGRYQTAFGHRRIRAVSILGIPVRAIVRAMTDEEMVVAQGQENHARKDLSYIEKVRFAQRLETRFRRETIMAAMSIHKSDLSNMLTVAHRIPEAVSDAIGPAPKTGRRGWIELAELMKNPGLGEKTGKLIADPQLQTQDSDERFKTVLSLLKVPNPRKQPDQLTDRHGQSFGTVLCTPRNVTITVDRKKSPAFADFLLSRIQGLHEEFAAGKSKSNETLQ
jgi:ParB family chromosome partitioning protein